ncbi:hypothetical protein N3K66_006386 [Trichothecium roseum]|uniref:Uncharacterized protein n=1 Tax=Trichothecium roseum TaxID=47278 RepID=A0ACC0UV88_9HYPO|nr:hypothetical protein N3K66_006386 [Trichothecium roseum]
MSDEISELFRLQYAEAIKQQVLGDDLGSKIFFLANEVQKGPLAGRNIPEAYTNLGLFHLGNNLLTTDNIYYNPSSIHGFDRAVRTYLNWVDSGGNDDDALHDKFLSLLKDQNRAEKALGREIKNGLESYKTEKEMGMVEQPFNEWITFNFPSFKEIKNNADGIANKIRGMQAQKGGAMAPSLDKDMGSLNAAREVLTHIYGFNMPVAAGSPLSSSEILHKLQSGETIPPPDSYHLPLYHSPTYKGFVQEAMNKGGSSDYNPSNSIDVEIDTSKNTSDYNFGQTEGEPSGGIGWLAFNLSGDASTESSTLQTGSESSEVSVKITYDNLQAVDIIPGNWAADLSKYTLRSDAPEGVKTLAKVTQIVVVSGLGYEIEVGAETAETLDQMLQETENAGGTVTVFGIPIQLGAEDTHYTAWDKDSRTFRVIPNYNNNVATVVGVIGEAVGA